GAEPTRTYKPQPQAYLGTAEYLSLAPQQCMLVAAHPNDLKAAQSLGFRAAYVKRPLENGPGHTAPPGDPSFDFTVNSMEELAAALGC
ncbi:MAG TPA: haloacid dehalogenase type II, partial [bacterium]|nr:haloacid dehalogenase type II [bacterium]